MALNKVEKVVKIVYSRAGHVERVDVQLACTLLENHGVIAVPTDTLYGLASRLDDSQALERIYKIKGRDPKKPLALCLSELGQIEKFADVNDYNRRVLPSLLPGPLTLVMNRSSSLNKDFNPSNNTVGIRIPDHNFVRQIIREIDCPLALTSANKSGETNPIIIEDFRDIWDDIDGIFDLGRLRATTPVIESPTGQRQLGGSTVIDLTEERAFKILREGCAYYRTLNILHRFGFKNNSRKR